KRVERPVLPFPDLLEHRIGDPADQIGRDLDPVKFLQMGLDLANRQPAGIEADDPVIKTVEAGLPFADNLRLEAAVAVARNRNLDRTVVANQRLVRIAVAAVATATTGRIAPLISQMLSQLGAERPFQKPLLEFLEQSFPRPADLAASYSLAAAVPTQEGEFPHDAGSHLTRRWREMDSSL